MIASRTCATGAIMPGGGSLIWNEPTHSFYYTVPNMRKDEQQHNKTGRKKDILPGLQDIHRAGTNINGGHAIQRRHPDLTNSIDLAPIKTTQEQPEPKELDYDAIKAGIPGDDTADKMLSVLIKLLDTVTKNQVRLNDNLVIMNNNLIKGVQQITKNQVTINESVVAFHRAM